MINEKDETNDKLNENKKIEVEKLDEKSEDIGDIENIIPVDSELPDDDSDDSETLDVDAPDSDETVYFKFNTTNHKLEGKHRLKRDTIFNGKLDDDEDEDIYSSNSDYFNKDFPIEKGSSFDMESRNFEEMENQRQLKINIYNILSENTDLDFTSNRRKPNKQAFNNYYEMLLDGLNDRYTKSEIFVELSYYFTDNIFNMFKLLDKSNATGIIMELKDKGYLNDIGSINFI